MSSHVEDVYLELVEDVGLAPAFLRQPDGTEVENPAAGEPEPLNNIRFQIPVPVMVDGQLAMTTNSAHVVPGDDLDEVTLTRIIPGTRVVHTQAPAVVDVLMNTGHYRLVDPPERKAANRQAMKKGQLEEAARAAGIDATGLTKDQLVAALEQAERAQAGEAQPTAADVVAAAAADAVGEPGEITAGTAGEQLNPNTDGAGDAPQEA